MRILDCGLDEAMGQLTESERTLMVNGGAVIQRVDGVVTFDEVKFVDMKTTHRNYPEVKV